MISFGAMSVILEICHGTGDYYRDLLRIHLLPVFGDLKMDSIPRGKVKDFLLGKINEGCAKSTVNHMKNVVSGDSLIPTTGEAGCSESPRMTISRMCQNS